MKKGWVIAIIIMLVLILGVQTGYMLKMHQELKQRLADETNTRYQPSVRVMQRSHSPTASRRIQPTAWRQSGFWDAMDSDSWDPFKEMEDMQRLMNRMFRDSVSRGMTSGALQGAHDLNYDPDVDFKETDKEYIAHIDLPGIDKDKVSIKIQHGQLVISGQREVEKEERGDNNGGFYRSERSFGSFMRSLPLPADADPEQMTAQCQNGVLTIRLPKIASAAKEPKTIKIQ